MRIQYLIMLPITFWTLCGAAANAAEQRAADSQAQAAPAAKDSATQFVVESIRGAPGTTIPLKIRLPASLTTAPAARTAYTFLMFKGLPEDFKLSSGFRTRNSWIVAIDEVRTLSVEVPRNYEGTVIVEVFFYRGEAVAPQGEVFAVQVSRTPSGVAVSAELKAVSRPATAATIKTPAARDPNFSKEDEEALLEQADEQLQNGNIVFARVLFEELASHGSARGTFALARTYDPNVLKKLGAVGMQGDIEKAMDLYQRAAELWNASGAEALGSLGK